MDWLVELFKGDSVAHSAMIIALVAVLGLALGRVKIVGVGLGVAGVLFSGIVFGHFGIGINHDVLEFLRDFGLVLFVFSIGLKVGPGFLDSLKKQGLPLNLLAAAIVFLGVGMTLLVAKIGNLPIPVATGLFSGATTNTPSLAAAGEAIKEVLGKDPAALATASKLPGQGYAVAYPFGIMGIILTMLLVRMLFKVNVESENAEYNETATSEPLTTRNLKVSNRKLQGVRLSAVPAMAGTDVVVSRVMRNNSVQVADPEMTLEDGDVLLGVGEKEQLRRLEALIGHKADVDLKAHASDIVTKRIVVTQDRVMGKTLDEVGALQDTDVTVTRVRRMEIELTAKPKFKLQFGDSLLVVGKEEAVDRVAEELGNAPHQLEETRMPALFAGIALGVLVGSFPIQIPGVPAPVKLGLAGGPLLVSLILSRLGRLGPLVFYVPKSANVLMRELGIVLFLACVGLKSGNGFVETLTNGSGFTWMAYGALITAVPLVLVGLAARAIWKMSYPTICGVLAGSMTDPPALAFAGSLNNSEGPSLSYATVYPLVMLLRVVCAQAIVLFFLH